MALGAIFLILCANRSTPTGRTIRAAAIGDALEVVEALGGDRARVLAASGFDASELADRERLVDLEGVLRLVNAAAAEVRDDALGMHLAERWDLAALGVLSYAVFNAPTVGTALRNLSRYGRSYVQAGGIRFASQVREARIELELAASDPELARHQVEASAVVAVRILRRLVDDAFRPRRVLFAHRRPGDLSEHRRLLDCPLEFGRAPHLAVVFDADVLPRPVIGADRGLLPLIERHLSEALGDREEEAWLVALRSAVGQSLCDGNPAIGSIARQLGMSGRTLQRRLEQRGIVFRSLVAQTRRELADHYLAKGDANLTEVAFLLGYADLSAFHRAFRRWTGSTPREARRRLRAASAP